MTTIEELTEVIAQQHGIDRQAAEAAVLVHVDQIADDTDLYRDHQLTPAGAEVVTGAIAASYENGYLATASARLLDEIADAVRELAAAKSAEEAAEEKRDELIRQAMRPGSELRPRDIAAAADLKPARLYQIRDGRR